MITNNQYKIIAGQIAKLFCPIDPICEASVKERLIQKLNDEIFSVSFLPNLSNGRFYEMNFTDFAVITQPPKAKLKWKTHFLDIVTGNIEDFWFETAWYKVTMNDIRLKMINEGYQIVSNNKTITEQNFIEKRIVYNSNKPDYNIIYTPPVPGGGGGGSGGGGGNIIPTPAVVPNVPVTSGFDFGELLKNPIVLIGIGVAAYLLLIKK